MSTSVSSFGSLLRELRKRAGLSQRRLARLVSFDTSLVSKVETGAVPPSPAFAAACDSALEAEGALLALLPEPVLEPDEEERLALAARSPSRVDAAVVASLATMLAAHRTLEDTVGSTRLLNPVTAQLAVIEDLLHEARGAIRPAVLDIAHQWAQFCAWLHASAGRHDQARAWFDRAMTWAVEAESPDMIGTILTFQGHLAWKSGRIGPMISLSQAAQRNAAVFAGQRGCAAQQEARGHAILGDADEMARKTDEAIALGLRARERDDPPAWMYYHSDAFFQMERGLAYRYLGRDSRRHNQRAIESLSSGLAGIPADMRESGMGRRLRVPPRDRASPGRRPRCCPGRDDGGRGHRPGHRGATAHGAGTAAAGAPEPLTRRSPATLGWGITFDRALPQRLVRSC